MLLSVAVWVVLAVDPLQALEQQQTALFEQLAPSVVFITADNSLGSGVVVSQGLVLTNGHVVGSRQTVDVVLHDGRKAKGTVIERAADDIDLALVRLPVKDVPVARVAFDSSLKVGSWVGAIGHGEGSVWSFNVGMVSNVYDGKSTKQVFQTQIPLNPGNSGGPIFDRTGLVVGIVTAGLKGANSINFGIDASVAFRSLVGMRTTVPSLALHGPAGVPLFLDGKSVGMGPVVVVPQLSRAAEAFAIINGAMVKVQVGAGEREVYLVAPVVK
jgi:serine protease Do